MNSLSWCYIDATAKESIILSKKKFLFEITKKNEKKMRKGFKNVLLRRVYSLF